MKTLLIPTDFSAGAAQALKFSHHLARQIKADIVICNAVLVPSATTPSGLVVWPMEEPKGLLKESRDALLQLKIGLDGAGDNEGFAPAIRCLSEAGEVTDVVNKLIKSESIDMVVIGTHDTEGVNSLLLGNQSRSMIDDINRPLILVPAGAKIGPVKKIAFATDFKHAGDDMEAIFTLIEWARPLKAHVLLTQIYEEGDHSEEFQSRIKQFVKEIAGKANYPHIDYRVFANTGAVSGLLWLYENAQIDILAIVHRTHNFIDSLFRGNQSYKVTNHIPVPLWVFPTNL